MLFNTRIDRYKIASAITIGILRDPPFTHNHKIKASQNERLVNEYLAFFTGIYIIATFKVDEEQCFTRSENFDISTVLEYPEIENEESLRNLILKGFHIDRSENQLGCLLLHNFYILLEKFMVI